MTKILILIGLAYSLSACSIEAGSPEPIPQPVVKPTPTLQSLATTDPSVSEKNWNKVIISKPRYSEFVEFEIYPEKDIYLQWEGQTEVKVSPCLSKVDVSGMWYKYNKDGVLLGRSSINTVSGAIYPAQAGYRHKLELHFEGATGSCNRLDYAFYLTHHPANVGY